MVSKDALQVFLKCKYCSSNFKEVLATDVPILKSNVLELLFHSNQKLSHTFIIVSTLFLCLWFISGHPYHVLLI